MKTAEEWLNSWDKRNTDVQDWSEHIAILKQIQLDAIKEGMRRAAYVVHERRDAYAKVESGWSYCDQDRKAILTTAEQLTVDSL